MNKIIRFKLPFEIEFEKMDKYLKSFKEPKDDIDRSFFQYKCQMQQCNLITKVILNVGSILMLFFYLLKIKKIDCEIVLNEKKAIFYSNGMNIDILPKSLKEEYHIIIAEEKSPEMLDNMGRMVLREMFSRHPFSYYFLAKNLMKIAIYGEIINNERCGTIICSCEYSFTSSMLTYYCNCKGVKHINIMHGEKLFFIRDAFFHFNVFYIWDLYYKKLFTKLRASADVYKEELPDSFVFRESQKRIEKGVDYKYYLQAENTEMLKKINEVLLILKKRGKKVVVRPHPLYSENSKIESIFRGITIENTREINIEDSILETKYVISLYSTVLFQAYINDVKIVVDDYTNPNVYKALKQLDYIIINKKNTKLSQIVKQFIDYA